MSNYIDPEKFASALVSSHDWESSQSSIAPRKINVEKALNVYVDAVDKAKKFNEEYSKKQEKQKSQELSEGLDVLNNLKF
ncbi:hypothetical protein ISO99_04930 [Staphylococcus sp. 18_1_E_LY]|uniref:Uncharacterized protein n=1 Tax=Staphylococcus lloydii TaxID=2781774 RepID=A0A7T1F9E4_9STAP|nr:hypothetical protein [Staphylococcus lloydii]MBF7019251.1 hypothetical protein [Staphylococcus lloydii]MBF7026979.1 hypothetical protein [Staphylococcus lloydii]QPM74626.1 hypothetical protein ISP08_09790 [Staphylococcus lloydii]